MKILRWLALLLGLGAFVALILGNGLQQIGDVLIKGGPKLLLVPIVMVIPMIVDAKGWQILVSNPPALRRFFYARWIGESVNTLLPVAQIGGLFVKSYLLGKRLNESGLAMASTIIADTVSAVSLLVFIGMTLDLMAIHRIAPSILLTLAAASIIFCLQIYVFYRLQIGRALHLPSRLRKWLSTLTAYAGANSESGGIKGNLKAIYADRPRILKSLLAQFFGWVIGTIEVWIIVHLLGGTVSVIDALILEGAGQAVRNIAFFIPGALGLQEGAYLLIGTMLGLPSTLALSISLVKRFRELAQGLPGLLVWQANEGWHLLGRLRQR